MSQISFDRFFSPLSAESFIKMVGECKVVTVQRNDPDFFNEILTIEELNTLLLLSESLCNIDVKVIHPKKVFPDETYIAYDTTQNVRMKTRVDLQKIYELFDREKAYIQISHYMHAVPKVQTLVNTLQVIMGCKIKPEILIAHANAEKFPVRKNKVEQFIIQLFGESRYRLYDHCANFSSEPMNKDSEVLPFIDQSMRAGDMICIPKGFSYETESITGPSIELRLYCQYRTYAGFVAAMIKCLESQEDMMRASFAAKELMSGAIIEDFLERFKRKLIDSLTQENFNAWQKGTEPSMGEKGIRIFT